MPFDGPPPTRSRADFWSLRFVEETLASATPCARTSPLPLRATTDRGVMATVYADGGYGYAATGDIRPPGCAAALERARALGARDRRVARSFDTRTLPRAGAARRVRSPVVDAPAPLAPRLVRPPACANRAAAAIDPRIVDWEAGVEVRTATHRLVTSAGGDVVQRYRFLLPGLSATAHADGDTQTRTLNGYRGICQQGGLEVLARFGFVGAGAPRRRGGARAPRRAQLPERHDGRAARCPTR